MWNCIFICGNSSFLWVLNRESNSVIGGHIQSFQRWRNIGYLPKSSTSFGESDSSLFPIPEKQLETHGVFDLFPGIHFWTIRILTSKNLLWVSGITQSICFWISYHLEKDSRECEKMDWKAWLKKVTVEYYSTSRDSWINAQSPVSIF